MQYYSAMKRNEIMPSAAIRMDLEIIILSEASRTNTNIIGCNLYVESKKNDTKEHIYKTKTGLQT